MGLFSALNGETWLLLILLLLLLLLLLITSAK